ncbi:MAG: DUF1570 domain-containing protein [Planctomycetota bacterium]
MIRHLLLLLAAMTMPPMTARGEGPANFMMATKVDGKRLEGQPLVWDQRQMFMLGRDGELYDFAPKTAEDSRKIGRGFRGYSISEMRQKVRQEFDRSFAISTTNHFVVVHPRGEWGAWSDRLESLYRSFVHYMTVRGFNIRQPSVALVAVVFRNQSEYYRYAAANGSNLQPGTLGHYDPKSNRIFLFDASDGTGDDWSANAATIIHEATHQTAYNVGVHRRFAEQPRWLVEGLAMMFESRGVWDSRSSYTRADRINAGRLYDFKLGLKQRSSSVIKQLVASDRLFRSSARQAYAEAWTLSFFLSETRPIQYSDYLARVAARKPFSKYSARARLADFVKVFGSDLEMLDVQMQRFVGDL